MSTKESKAYAREHAKPLFNGKKTFRCQCGSYHKNSSKECPKKFKK